MDTKNENYMSEILERELFWEKYRPQAIEDIILPDRILELIKHGIYGNYLFYSTPGTGKTSLIKILVKDNPHIFLKGKMGVEELRTIVSDFCRKSIPFEDPTKLRVVVFEEFDRASSQLQDDLKTFIEEYSSRVRFLATSNNISKIDDAIKSRFNLINFRPSPDEIKALKLKHCIRIDEILLRDGFKVSKKDISGFVNKRYPDLRKTWNDIQEFVLSGSSSVIDTSNDNDVELYKMVMNPKSDILTWEDIEINWYEDISLAFELLGNGLFDHIRKNHPEHHTKLGNIMCLVSDYGDLRLSNAVDPFITLYSLVIKIQNLFK